MDADLSAGTAVLAVVAGGGITFLTATVGQLLGERFRRNADDRRSELARAHTRDDRRRAALDELLHTRQELFKALAHDRAMDLETARQPGARLVNETDAAFREAVARVADEDVRTQARAWRDLAVAYAASRRGDRGAPSLAQVDAAFEVFVTAVGGVLRQLD